MFSTLRDRMGIPGIISVIALVFAMTGGAYAAKDVIGDKASSSAKKGKQGKRGPRGPAGPAGAVGPVGPVGPAGATGDKGDKGDKGDTGGQGQQGQQGIPGQDGDPWTVGGTLPTEATLTGPWSATVTSDAPAQIPIPFNIPLEAALPATRTHYINAAGLEVGGPNNGNAQVACPGNAADPSADSGHLCVYEEYVLAVGGTWDPDIQNPGTKVATGPFFVPGKGASVAGAILTDFGSNFSGFAFGTWAVTGE